MNPFQDLFDRQKSHFATGVTRGYDWRIEQLDRMGQLLSENEAALQRAISEDFKTASQEYISKHSLASGKSRSRRAN